jgi:hypothetical protein
VIPLAAGSYHLKSDCADRQHQQELEKDRARYRPSHHFRDAKVAPEIAPDIRSSPYYIPPFSGITGGYSKVAAVTRMY